MPVSLGRLLRTVAVGALRHGATGRLGTVARRLAEQPEHLPGQGTGKVV
jgi:hypothetical protein